MRLVKPELKGKAKKFADNYLANGLNATQAYLEAGYKVKTEAAAASAASRLLRTVKVSTYIDYQLDMIEKSKIAEATEVLQTLTRIMRREETEDQVVITKNPTAVTLESAEGEFYDKFAYEESAEVVQTRTKNSDVVRAADLIGKYHKMWTDKFDIDGNMDLKVVVDYGDGGNEAPDDS